jgi:hypothetical protein
VLQSLLASGGVADPPGFARRLLHWRHHGFEQLGARNNSKLGSTKVEASTELHLQYTVSHAELHLERAAIVAGDEGAAGLGAHTKHVVGSEGFVERPREVHLSKV